MTPQAPRVRFAPSPTGFLHIGGVRTALFNWLYAKRFKGQFLLRIEDTDLERSEEQYASDILASMKWLGLTWDEEPIFQSKNLEQYREVADDLVKRGLAYHCDCSEADVQAMREAATKDGKKPKYSGHCRKRGVKPGSGDKPTVIRVHLPDEGAVEFTDLIRGQIRTENTELDDFVIIRSNGAPTYNLSVVVDDGGSRISHVIRGDDHINNTPKQIHLYRALGLPEPKFAHLPMILGPDKKKLSKRHGAVSANVYRADGYLPEALLNFLARLGWSHGDQEVFSIDEMSSLFDFDHVQKSSGVFNAEKLMWLNGEHIRKRAPETLAEIISGDYRKEFDKISDIDRVSSPIGHRLIGLVQQKVKLMRELADQMIPLCMPAAPEVDASSLKWNKDPALKAATQAAVQMCMNELSTKVNAVVGFNRTGADAVWGHTPSLGDLGDGAAMKHADIDAYLRNLSERSGVKLGDLTQPMRLCVTGRMASAGLFDLLEVLPWDIVEPRLKKVLSL